MKRILQLAALTAAVVAQPALAAEKVTVCHKGRETLSVAQRALPAHLGHGDTEGSCPVIGPPVPAPVSVVLLRCDSVDGEMMLISVSASEDPAVPVTLPALEGVNCATAVAALMNEGWELEFVTSGASGTPGEGESGFVTEYTFISAPSDDDDED